MKQKLIIVAIVVMTALTVLYGAGTTVNGTRVINGDLTVKGTCTGCSGGLTIGTTTVSSGTSTYLLYNNAGTLGNIQVVPGTQGGGLVLLEQHAASSSAAITFTTCITSAYDEYEIEFLGVTFSTTGVTPRIEVSTDGGMNWDSTSGHYSWNWNYSDSAGVGGIRNASDVGILFRDVTSTQVANTGLNATLKLYQPLSTTLYKMFLGQETFNNSGSNIPSLFHGGGLYLQTGAMNAFRLIPNTGTFTVGTGRCYGLAK